MLSLILWPISLDCRVMSSFSRENPFWRYTVIPWEFCSCSGVFRVDTHLQEQVQVQLQVQVHVQVQLTHHRALPSLASS